MKRIAILVASLNLVACGSSSDSIPDSRSTFDSSVHVDATPGAAVTVHVNLFGAAAANAGIHVLFDPPTGDAIETVTDSTGVASAIVPANTSVTVGGQVSADNGGQYAFVSFLGANPGDDFVLGSPTPAAVTINSLIVNITPFDQTSSVELRTPCSTLAKATSGATSVTLAGASCLDEPFDILAIIRDADTQEVTEWTALTGQTPVDGMTYTLPSTWNDANTFQATVANVPSIYAADTALHLQQFSQDLLFNQEDIGGVSADGGTAVNQLNYAPVAQQVMKISLNSSDSKHKYDAQFSTFTDSETFDVGANAFPQIDSPVFASASRAVTWAEEPLVGTAATITGRAVSISYQVSGAGDPAIVRWGVVAPPGSASVALPQLPSAFSSVDITNGAAVQIVVHDVSMASTVSYRAFVEFLAGSFNKGYEAVPGGLWIDSGGSN